MDAASSALNDVDEMMREGEEDESELQIYKELLAKAQSEQIKITREYQKLVKEQQLKIRHLEKATTLYDSDVKTFSREEDSETVEKIVAEHELRLKESMMERNDALVKYEKTKRLLQQRRLETKKLKTQNEELETRTQKMIKTQRENVTTHEADMERLVAEYSKLVTSSSDREGQFKRQISELRTQLLSQRPTSETNEGHSKEKTSRVKMLESEISSLRHTESEVRSEISVYSKEKTSRVKTFENEISALRDTESEARNEISILKQTEIDAKSEVSTLRHSNNDLMRNLQHEIEHVRKVRVEQSNESLGIEMAKHERILEKHRTSCLSAATHNITHTVKTTQVKSMSPHFVKPKRHFETNTLFTLKGYVQSTILNSRVYT